MNVGEDIHNSYYSAILARSLKQDDKNFKILYNLICQVASKEQVGPHVTFDRSWTWYFSIGTGFRDAPRNFQRGGFW